MTNHDLSWFQRIWRDLKELTTRQGRPNAYQHQNDHHYRHEFIIIGLGRFGTSLAMTLNAYNHDVLAIDLDFKRVQQLSNTLPHVIQLDATDLEALREVGAESFDTGVVCIGTDFEANILATVSLRKLGVRRVITKARTITQQDILKKVGADEVILPEHEAGVRLARKLTAVDFVDFMELTDDTGVVELVAPEQFIGQSLREANVRQHFGLTVVAIRRNNNVIISPDAEEIIKPNDILVVLGRTTDCERLRQL